MKSGFLGAYVISWSQTEVDGQTVAPVMSVMTGAVWSWRGDALRVDGPANVLQLDQAMGAEELRQRASKVVTRLVGAAVHPDGDKAELTDARQDALMTMGFAVTDGREVFQITMIPVAGAARPLLMFLNEMPPKDTDLWVVDTHFDAVDRLDEAAEAGGMICFTPGTMIETPIGPRPVEDLQPGDLVQTRDSGAQEIRWAGHRRMTGARLFAMPRLRPVRILEGALGTDRPNPELLVSPDHQLLVTGKAAQALFNEPEVLVKARHLVNGADVIVEPTRRAVTYHHLLLPRHEILIANGVACDSFHPETADLTGLPEDELQGLLAAFPAEQTSYGAPARRELTQSETAIMGHVA